jgi:hypothetical protein
MLWDISSLHSGVGGSRVYTANDTDNTVFDNRNLHDNASFNSQFTSHGGMLNRDVVEVFHYEQIENNKQTITNKKEIAKYFPTTTEQSELPSKLDIYVQSRYECYSIGNRLYFGMGKSKYESRNLRDSRRLKLTYNGVNYQDKDGKPYSMLLATKDAQDIHDILVFHLENLINTSGSRGTRVSVQDIPEYFGDTFAEKLSKFLAYRKAGVEFIDPNIDEEGRAFNYYGTFDNSVNPNAVEAIRHVIEQVKDEISYDTGVTPNMIAQTSAREAVGNVQVNMLQSSYMTKGLFQYINTMAEHMLTDLIDYTRMSYGTTDEGLRGSYRSNNNTMVPFHLKPDILSMVSFNLSISDNREDKIMLQKMQEICGELIKSGMADFEIVNIYTTNKSLSYAKKAVAKHLNKTKQQQEEAQQMKQQLEQLGQQNKELEKQIKSLTKKELDLKQAELKLKELDVNSGIEIDKDRLSIEREKIAREAEAKKQHLRLEEAQLYTGSGKSQEIKDI